MNRFLTHWFTVTVSLGVAVWILDGIRVGSIFALLVAALVLGLVNAIIRPVLVILTFPITVITLGLFYLVVNGCAFALAAVVVPGFEVASMWSAIAGALVVSIVSWFIGQLTGGDQRRNRRD